MTDDILDSALDDGMKVGFGGTSEASSVLEALAAMLGEGSPVTLAPRDDEIDGVITPETQKGLANTGRYRVMGEIAKGGVGVVMRARDVDLGRDVAVKVLRPEHEGREQVVHRFIEEAQIGGQLQHPGIVPVYEMGLVADRRPYFAMKLVKGDTLTALIERRRDPGEEQRRFLSIFEQVCHTVAYAHARGVIHRDLKPSNIMVGAFGEVQVVDWGFAKVLAQGGVADERRSARRRKTKRPDSTIIRTVRTGSSGSESQPGSVLGTPAYMPPEQALGEIDKIDERSDVFMLGAILCYILTGDPPYTGDGREALIKAARSDLADAHARLDVSNADATLVDLCRACLSPERRKRPRDAGEVASGIEEHLASVERRAREAEIAAAEAITKAVGERKARRLTVAIAAATIVTVLASVAGLAYVKAQSAGRAAETSRLLAMELDAAVRHQGEAEMLAGIAATEEEEDRSWERAREAVDRARGILDKETVDDSAHERFTAAAASIENAAAAAAARRIERERQHRFRARLEEIRLGSELVEGRRLAFETAFRDFGVDPVADGIEASVARLSEVTDPEVRTEIVSALESWAMAAGGYDYRPSEPGERLLGIADRVDGSPTRSKIREAARSREKQVLRDLASRGEPDVREGNTPNVLASHLCRLASPEDAVSFLLQIHRERPADFRVNLQLANTMALLDPKPVGDQIGYLRAAFAARPDSMPVRMSLGSSLYEWGDPDAALEVWLGGLRTDPSRFLYWPEALEAVRESGRLDEVLPSLEKRAKEEPDDAPRQFVFASALEIAESWDDAARAYQAAVRLDGKNARYRIRLAISLLKADRWKPALEAYRQACELRPQDAEFHARFAHALLQGGHADEAIVAWRQVAALRPGTLGPHFNLGIALTKLGRLKDARASFRVAVDIAPKNALVHYMIGLNLKREGAPLKAGDFLRRAVQLRTDLPRAEREYGYVLLSLGETENAMKRFRNYHELSEWPAGGRYPLERWLEDVRLQAGLLPRIVDAVHEEDLGIAPREQLLLACLCYDLARYRLSAKLFQKAFAEDASLKTEMTPFPVPGTNVGWAACAAALASAGRGIDGKQLDEAQITRWRGRAIEWLGEEVTCWRKRGEEGDEALARAALQSLRTPQFDLYPLLVKKRVAMMPEKDRAALRAVQDEVGQWLEEHNE